MPLACCVAGKLLRSPWCGQHGLSSSTRVGPCRRGRRHQGDSAVGLRHTCIRFATQFAAKHKQMIAPGGGRIIKISSVHEDGPMPNNTPYCCAKEAVTSYITATTIFADGGIMQSSPGL